MANKKLRIILDTNILINFFLDSGLLIDIVSDLNLCRDKKDNFLLNLAMDGKADFILIGDKDLLELNPSGNTRIIPISEFLRIND
jgi:predicted nucleic acid-binding protein